MAYFTPSGVLKICGAATAGELADVAIAATAAALAEETNALLENPSVFIDNENDVA
jgi:hypothetical protein